MKKRKLNYVIHNPNTIEKTADFLLEILIEANAEKVERLIKEAAEVSEVLEDEEKECVV